MLYLLQASQASAVDVTLLLGYQADGSFELSNSIENLPDDPVLGESGDSLDLESGLAASLAVDFVFKDNVNQRLGFYISHHETQFDSQAGLENSDLGVTHLHFTAMNYYPSGKSEPFVAAGIGGGHFSVADRSLKDVTVFSAQIAGGTNYKLTDALLLRLEARWIGSFFNGSSAIFCSGGCAIAVKSDIYSQFQANIGLQYRF